MTTDLAKIEERLEGLIESIKMGLRYTADITYMHVYNSGILDSVEILEIIPTHLNEFIVITRTKEGLPLTLWQREILELSKPREIGFVEYEEASYEKEALANMIEDAQYVSVNFDYVDIKKKTVETFSEVVFLKRENDSNLVEGRVTGEPKTRFFFWDRITNVETVHIIHGNSN